MAFLTEPEPPRGVALPVLPGIRRVVAPNRTPMTYWGTNTYLLDASDGVLVLDPGPDDATHVEAVLAAAGAPVIGIILTHGHHDHLGATAALRAATGAPVHAWHVPEVPGFVPDVALADGGRVGPWTAVYTPGHAMDHLCFAGPGGVLFSGDHVMGWSSTVVGPPPAGDMAAYFHSLGVLLDRDDAVFLPGHGPPLPEPRGFVRDLLQHRISREASIHHALNGSPQTPGELMQALYSKIDPTLRRAAERNVSAHLDKLAREGRAEQVESGWIHGPG